MKRMGQKNGFLNLEKFGATWMFENLKPSLRKGESISNTEDAVAGRLTPESEYEHVEITDPEIIQRALRALSKGGIGAFKDYIQKNPSLLFNLLGLDLGEVKNLGFELVKKISNRQWLDTSRTNSTEELFREFIRRVKEKEELGETALTLFARMIEDPYSWRFLNRAAFENIGLLIKEAAKMLEVNMDPENPYELARFLRGLIKLGMIFYEKGIIWRLETEKIVAYTAAAIEDYRNHADPSGRVKALADFVFLDLEKIILQEVGKDYPSYLKEIMEIFQGILSNR
jgi:hypothetical protein